VQHGAFSLRQRESRKPLKIREINTEAAAVQANGPISAA
jgi:hypothetical protein